MIIQMNQSPGGSAGLVGPKKPQLYPSCCHCASVKALRTLILSCSPFKLSKLAFDNFKCATLPLLRGDVAAEYFQSLGWSTIAARIGVGAVADRNPLAGRTPDEAYGASEIERSAA